MLSLGIVGLPNVGKSTLFKALTKKRIDISNYPFTTIDPNIGIVAVPDYRLDKLAIMSGSEKIVPTAIEFIDIAGLVKGAAKGEGLGNKFLANIREVDAIVHVVRVFEDSDIDHIHKKVDPVNDVAVIKTELELADLQSKENREKKKDKNLPPLLLLTEKKVIYVFNISELQLKSGWQPDPALIEAIGDCEHVSVSNTFELLLSEASNDERQAYLADVGLDQSGLDELILKSYKSLDLLTFLTTGAQETRAWTTRQGSTMPESARAIHSDFETKFIRADVINWQELLNIGSWSQARSVGKIKTVGRDYITQEGDVVEIKI